MYAPRVSLGERVRKDLAYWRGVVKPLGIRAD